LIEGTVAIFMADVEGSRADPDATVADATRREKRWLVTASTYFGVGAMDGSQWRSPRAACATQTWL